MNPDQKELFAMLAWSRPFDTPMEQEFINTFVLPLGGVRDNFGNVLLRIGAGRVLWSCHTDTVDRHEAMKSITISEGQLRLANGRAGMCLGADDTAGVWIMNSMVRAKVPGLYIWHRGEEKGGLGSQWIATRSPGSLAGIDAAIAFDRKGTSSIITHQFGQRCCSEAFSRSLATNLPAGYRSDSTGLFTDTANYMHLIPECTNLSVGYEREHGPTETLDYAHVERLCRHMCLWRTGLGLTIERDPAYETYPSVNDVVEYDEEMIELVRDFPELAAKLLADCGVTRAEFEQHIINNGAF